MTKPLFLLRYGVFILILFSCTLGFSQDSLVVKKSSPILYVEGFLGIGNLKGDIGGFYGFGLNYQYKNNFFSLRFTENYRRTVSSRVLLIFSNVTERRTDTEFAFLYGIRKVEKGSSWNASAGISINQYIQRNYDQFDNQYITAYPYVGLAYEFTIRLFKAKKKRYNIYIYPIPIPIPVGKPTGFGRSIGFKFFGNASRRGFFGIGISYGLGVHKKY